MSLRRMIARPQAMLSLSVTALLLAGCGATTNVSHVTSPLGMSGKVFGGPNPVVGATITLYATTSGGYGAPATPLATAVTGANGSFSITTPYTCPTGQYAYITGSGGDAGAGANPNAVLLAALGPCGNLSATSSIYISEATTVAASYALANFMSVTGNTVNISSSAANNDPAATCTPASGANAATCTANGLGHAFANALNIADSIQQSGQSPDGRIYQVTPSNLKGSVPTAMLNVVANALFACVNSIGGTAGDGSNCGKLFTYTTPPTSSVAAPTTPTNTAGAMLNLAKFPTLTPANVTGLFGLIPSTPAFMPVLGGAPTDYSLAILYKGVTRGSTTTTFVYPYFVALDSNDDVFEANTLASSTGPLTFTGMASNGAALFASDGTTQGYTSTTYIAPRMMATDLSGNVFLPNNSASSSVVLQLSGATGTLVNSITASSAGAPYGVAVDSANNAYFTLGTANVQSLYSIPAGSTTPVAVTPAGATYSSTNQPEALALDSTSSIWNQLFSASGTFLNYVANSGSLASPSFGTAAVASTDGAVGSGYGVVIDGSDNAWSNNTKTLYKTAKGAATPTSTYTISYTSPTGTTTTASSARYPALDGLGNIFLPDNIQGARVWQFLPDTGNFIFLAPCAAPAGATTCASAGGTSSGTAPGTGSLNGPRNAQVDSTGAIWIASSTNGNVVQIIGPGNPTWPALAYLKPGVRP